MKIPKKMTHSAIKAGNDARTPSNFRKVILLRETKNFWVDEHGTKYSKRTGSTVGDWPLYSILLDSIIKL